MKIGEVYINLLGNCEVRFCTGFNNKDKEFKIEKIVIDNDIIIYLKGGNI